MARQEFPRSVRVEIIKRATHSGVIYCEGCGLPAKRFDIDHSDADALKVDKSRRLTAADGKLLCSGARETCHGRKTAEEDIPAIAKAKRREAAHLGARPAPARKIANRGFAQSEKAARRQAKPKLEMLPEIFRRVRETDQ